MIDLPLCKRCAREARTNERSASRQKGCGGAHMNRVGFPCPEKCHPRLDYGAIRWGVNSRVAAHAAPVGPHMVQTNMDR